MAAVTFWQPRTPYPRKLLMKISSPCIRKRESAGKKSLIARRRFGRHWSAINARAKVLHQYRQFLQHARVGFMRVPVRLFIHQAEVGETCHQGRENNLSLGAGQQCTNAKMNPQSKRDMPVLLPA